MTNIKVTQGNGADSELNSVNPTVIKVVGCGGCGGNAVNTMIEANVQGVQFIAMNTDLQDLGKSQAHVKLQLGQKSAKGLGAGGKPEVGEEAAHEDENQIRELLNGSDMIFITAGMGGGTGTGAAPVVAKVAKEVGALTIAVVTTPFEFEAPKRMRNAEIGLKNLRSQVDSLIVIPNEQVFKAIEDDDVNIEDAYRTINDILRQGVQGISDIITQTGYMNRDFRDVQTVMKGQGDAIMGIGEASGDNRAINAADKAINNKLLEDTHIDGAKNILVNITGAPGKVKMSEPREIINLIRKRADPDVNVLWGQGIDESLDDKIRVTVIATGFNSAELSDKAALDQSSAESDGIRPDPNFVDEGTFERITKNPDEPERKIASRPEPVSAQKKKSSGDDLFGNLFGTIYEEESDGSTKTLRNSALSQGTQREKPQLQYETFDKPRGVTDYSGKNEEDIPAILRGVNPDTGYSNKMSFGKKN